MKSPADRNLNAVSGSSETDVFAADNGMILHRRNNPEQQAMSGAQRLLCQWYPS
ncbi:hypothetical protein QUF80_06525 [Desulfococcaceae bacterium HSG8]|nr:hypothetical protein [Desulfococcaceae bacterium HSG8]